MELDAVFLARLQFAFTVAFHIIFPTFTIGLSAWIATLLVIWRRTGDENYRTLARFWTRIFAVSFAMGVVSGIVLSYQFGTNWSHFSEVVGNVVGPLIGYEVLTAFFLEATFLGIMLFGWRHVPPWLHVLSAILVAIGTLFSAFWIISANSWMQFPAGHVVRDGIAYPVDWIKAAFNPTFHWRLIHMVTAAYLTTSFVVLSVGARYFLAGKFAVHSHTMLRMGIGMAAVLAPLQLLIGDQHGLDVAHYQPVKLAAIEAHWENHEGEGVPFVLFAVPNAETQKNDYEIAIPNVGSLLIEHSWDGQFPGLKDFPKEDHPPLVLPFFAFRIMVGIGLLMIATGLWGAWLWWRGKLDTSRNFMRVAAISWPAGFIAILSGWVVAEVGRQPWLATGILRTADAASPVAAGAVATTLLLFLIVYGIVFASGIYYMNRLINRGPEEGESPEGVASRPLTAAQGSHNILGGQGVVTMLELYLPIIWAVLIATAVIMYVVLDGFDLGIGILFPSTRKEEERDQMMNSIAPFWDGNETWLILGGGGLWVAFPKAYAVIMPAFYLPVIIMLLSLIFRGVSFEFRFVSKPNHRLWDFAFWGGSTLAAFSQGVILGGLIQGVTVVDGKFAGGTFDWATPFALLTGVAVVFGYALLGATWLIFKTEGPVQERARGQARALMLVVLVAIAAVSLWTPITTPRIAERWFAQPNIFFLWPVPLITAALGYVVWQGLERGRELQPFAGSVGLFVLSYLGLAISTFPFLVPPTLTIWDTAAVPDSQIFTLIGTVIMLPIILGYFVFVFWTFRAKVTVEGGYH